MPKNFFYFKDRLNIIKIFEVSGICSIITESTLIIHIQKCLIPVVLVKLKILFFIESHIRISI